MKQALIHQFNIANKYSMTSLSSTGVSLLTVPHFGYKKMVRRVVNHEYLNEVKDYENKMKVMREQHRKNYWES